MPALSHAAVLLNPASPVHTVYRRETETAAGRMGVKLEAVEVRQPEEFEEAVAAMARRRSGGFIVAPDPLFLIHRVRIVNLAAKHQLPALYPREITRVRRAHSLRTPHA